jgi:uncharacterized membrane protein
MMFAISALNRLETQVHQLVLLLAGVLAVMSMASFLYLIDYAARLLRPISILTRVAETGLSVIENLYREPTRRPDVALPASPGLGAPNRIVAHAGASRVILAVELQELIAAARAADGVVEVIPAVGDFVSKDDPLFALYGRAAAFNDGVLQAAVQFGTERTMEQDPTFSFRIVIDIALKALSPAINDPTTAVLAIDQLHRLLRQVGKRQLSDENFRDEAGTSARDLPHAQLGGLCDLAFSEIRRCGAGNFQVARRLRAHDRKPDAHASRAPPRRLATAADAARSRDRRQYSLPEDLALARGSTRKGWAEPRSSGPPAPRSINTAACAGPRARS